MSDFTCQRARQTFPELLDRRTDATAHLDARAHLAHCPDCQRDFAALSQTATQLDTLPAPEPSPRLRQNFYAMLEVEKHSAASIRAAGERQQRARRVSRWRWVLSPLAACALLAIGIAAGKRSRPSDPPPESASVDRTQREILALRDLIQRQGEQLARQNEQLNKMTTVFGYALLQQQQNPANERLKDVLLAARNEQPTDKTLDDLIQALTLDPNANVRLRAIEALYPHAHREVVRAGVLAALPREQNPLVQLELIDFVAAAGVFSAAPLLEKIAADESSNGSVRDAAKLALAQL
jgi:hypothetical protein